MYLKHSRSPKLGAFCTTTIVNESYGNTEKIEMKKIDAVSIAAAAKWQQGNGMQVVKSLRS